jgi:predicted nuclease of predicted toxin-antitoxin system
VKFLVDAQLPPLLAAWLSKRGHEAFAVRDIGLRDADDLIIWNWAASEQAIVVTKDEDFSLLATKDLGVVVLWIRLGNVSNRLLLQRLEASWTEIVGHLATGDRVVEIR